jgi:hypothetical protein
LNRRARNLPPHAHRNPQADRPGSLPSSTEMQ